jgi:hypothetical protein
VLGESKSIPGVYFAGRTGPTDNYCLSRFGIELLLLARDQFGGTLEGSIRPDRAWFLLPIKARERTTAHLSQLTGHLFVPENLTDERNTAALGVPVIQLACFASNTIIFAAHFAPKAFMNLGR